jgi:hypothetical protein
VTVGGPTKAHIIADVVGSKPYSKPLGTFSMIISLLSTKPRFIGCNTADTVCKVKARATKTLVHGMRVIVVCSRKN